MRFLRRGRSGRAGDPERAAFWAVAADVERAKEALLSAVPGPRRAPTPLAAALAGFEAALREAAAGMGTWRSPATEESWERCRAGLEEAARRAERLRLEAPALDFEALVLVLGDLMAPLEAFGEAARGLR